MKIFNGNCLDLLDQTFECAMIFADPPDNLGLMYDEYKDKLPKNLYYNFLYEVLQKSLRHTPCLWFSYYWEHDIEIKYMIRNLLKYERPTYSAKTFVWRYTFGQHKSTDFGSGFRFLVRLHNSRATFNADSVHVTSERQRIGDSRANPDGRVPDDVWDYPAIFDHPRVVGNAKERRPWHPTQHPEDLISRILRMHTDAGHLVVDLFGGTGTTLRVAKRLGRDAVISEISPNYCKAISAETDVEITTNPVDIF